MTPPLAFQPLPESFLDSSRPQQFKPHNSFGNFHIPAQLSFANFSRNEQLSGNLFGSLTQVKEKPAEKFVQNSVQKELDDTVYELPDLPKLELDNGLLSTLGVQPDDILEQKFVNEKQQEDAVLGQIKEEYNFDEIKDAFDEGTVPQQLDFFYGGENSSFNRAVEFLSPSNENREFIAFLLSDIGENLRTNNSLSIHIESEDMFYQNFNTGENFYNFLIAQQNYQTAPVPKRFSYHHSFEHYIQNFLQSFSLDDIDKFDLYSNKNSKYLFYRFIDYIKISGGKRHK